jgi:hypothetical protein
VRVVVVVALFRMVGFIVVRIAALSDKISRA